MKRPLHLATFLLLLLIINSPFSIAHAQGTAFTYQGRLNNGSNPATGLYDFQFALSNAPSGGSQIGGLVSNPGVAVSNGLFTTTIDFGTVLAGQPAWLAISVRTNGAITFAGLTPLQPLTPAPYAIFANAASNVSGSVSGSMVASIASANGNSFLGTAGNSGSGPWNTGVGDSALQFNSGSGNTALGYLTLSFNTSGGFNTAVGLDALQVLNPGSDNTAVGSHALANLTSGSQNIALGSHAGENLDTGSSNIYIGNQGLPADNNLIRIGDGQTHAYIAGLINGNGGELTNVSVIGSQVGSIGNNPGMENFFLGSAGNATDSGAYNTAVGQSAFSASSSGSANTAFGRQALKSNSSGVENTAMGVDAMIENTTGFQNTSIGALTLKFLQTGSQNIALGFQAGSQLGGADSFNIDIGNQGVSGDNNTIRIGNVQTNTFIAGTLNGDGRGLTNLSGANVYGVPLLGSPNTFAADQTINGQITAGGALGAITLLDRFHPVNAFGWQWRADNTGLNATRFNGGAGSQYFTITTNGQAGIGAITPVKQLEVAANASHVAAGSSIDASVFLRVDNTATDGNVSTPDYAGIGFGHNSTQQAIVGGTFGNDFLDFYTGGMLTSPKMRIDFSGNIGMGTTTITHPLDMASGAFCSVAGVWTSVSDRNVKEDFNLISPTEILSKVAAMPITEWKYKVEPQGTEHIGPMAQDFHEAFGLNGADDKHISAVDEGGVALAAIQGLNVKVEQLKKTLDDRDAAYDVLKRENAAMAQKLDDLQRLVQASLKRP